MRYLVSCTTQGCWFIAGAFYEQERLARHVAQAHEQVNDGHTAIVRDTLTSGGTATGQGGTGATERRPS